MEDALAAAARSLVQTPIGPILAEAAAVAVETGASVYDSLYVVLAERLGCALVTADGRLAAKIGGTRFASLIRLLDSR